MNIRTRTLAGAIAIVVGTVSSSAWAQRGGNSASVVLSEQRLTPAEQQIDPKYKAPHTSWGDPVIEGHWSTDDMRGIGATRDPKYGTEQSLNEEDFLARARSQEAGRESAEDTETFLRNEWGTRTFGFNSLVVEPADGQRPGITDEGRARAAMYRFGGTFGSGPFHKFTDFSMYDRCIARGINSGTNAAIYGNGIIIAQSPTSVAITYEMIHETRVIPLDSRPHLPSEVKQYGGNGRGHWEGDTLVIETMGFDPKVSVGGGTPSDNMKTTERIRRVHDQMIEYRITFDDPDTFEAPYTMRIMWTTEPGYYVWEYSCHEGNGAVGHSLSGERQWERNIAMAIAKGETPPVRGGSNSVYGGPGDGAEILDINSGEIFQE